MANQRSEISFVLIYRQELQIDTQTTLWPKSDASCCKFTGAKGSHHTRRCCVLFLGTPKQSAELTYHINSSAGGDMSSESFSTTLYDTWKLSIQSGHTHMPTQPAAVHDTMPMLTHMASLMGIRLCSSSVDSHVIGLFFAHVFTQRASPHNIQLFPQSALPHHLHRV